jgi:hypothetical protein
MSTEKIDYAAGRQAPLSRPSEPRGRLAGSSITSGRGTQYLSICYTDRFAEAVIEASAGSASGLVQQRDRGPVNALFKAEVINGRGVRASALSSAYTTWHGNAERHRLAWPGVAPLRRRRLPSVEAPRSTSRRPTSARSASASISSTSQNHQHRRTKGGAQRWACDRPGDNLRGGGASGSTEGRRHGELSVHGDVNVIGGVAEKLSAAARHGRKVVLIPAENASELQRLEGLGSKLQLSKSEQQTARYSPLDNSWQFDGTSLIQPNE